MIESIEPEPIEIPAVGESYTDPSFGSKVTRITDAKAEGVTFCGPEYSSVACHNFGNTKLLLIHQDRFHIHEGWSGKDLGATVGASSRPRWSRREPDIFYFLLENQVWYCNAATAHVERLYRFDEFSTIDDLGECDLVMDANGDHYITLCGTKGSSRAIFLFNLDQQTWYAKRHFSASDPIDSLSVTPDRNILVVFNGPTGEGPGKGLWMFNRDMEPLRQVTRADGHHAVTRDADGSEVMIWHNSDEPEPMTCRGGSIVKVRLADGHQTELINLDWATVAVDVSCQGNGPALISTYSKDLYRTAANDSDSLLERVWSPFQNELFLLPLDGGEVRRLAHTRSVGDGYQAQPRGCLRPDGKAAVYSTNWGDPTKDYSDCFAISI